MPQDDVAIEFICKEDQYGDAAEPTPAARVLPDWYKDLPTQDESGSSTVKACRSFLDALTMGWMLPVPYDIEIATSADGDELWFDTDVEFDVFDTHTRTQLGEETHPQLPRQVLKFHTPWAAKTAPGVSLLLTPPLNRHEPRFQPFSGVVDTEEHQMILNVPSLWMENPYSGTIEAGTPIVQVLAFDRSGLHSDAAVREMTPGESRKQKGLTEMFSTTDGVYAREMWKPKGASRIVPTEADADRDPDDPHNPHTAGDS